MFGSFESIAQINTLAPCWEQDLYSGWSLAGDALRHYVILDVLNLQARYRKAVSTSILITKSISGRWTSVVFVKSAQENIDRRDAIRETWADLVTYDGTTFFTVFVVGLKPDDEGKEPDSIIGEHNTNGDILLVDILDTDEWVNYQQSCKYMRSASLSHLKPSVVMLC